MTRVRGLVAMLLFACAFAPANAHAQSRAGRISLMVGGIEKQIYLPVILASRLGYFRAQGVDVEVLTEPSGVNAEDQLLAGAVQGVVGFYDHTIDLQAKGKLVRSVVQFSRIPGEVVLVATRHGGAIRSPADLKERPVGVTGLGSSTNFLVTYLATTGGVKTSDVRPLAVGAGDSFIDAMRAGRIHAGMTTEPTASRLLQAHEAQVLVDLRTVEGARKALGGLYPAACLYMREDWITTHRAEVRALAAALVQALQYLQTHEAQEVASLVPESFYAGNRALYVAALGRGKEMFTADGRMPPDGPQTVLQVMRVADPHVGQRKIDLGRTYTEDFVRATP
jgi:NitT/TauT family transport system substrate-binding protein